MREDKNTRFLRNRATKRIRQLLHIFSYYKERKEEKTQLVRKKSTGHFLLYSIFLISAFGIGKAKALFYRPFFSDLQPRLFTVKER